MNFKKNEENTKLEYLTNWQNTILDASPYSIVTTDTKGLITSMNLAAERMLGYKASELIGIHTPEIIHDKEETIAKANELCTQLKIKVEPNFFTYVKLSEMAGPTITEWTYIHKDGSRFPVRLCVSPIRDQEKQVIGYIGIAEDITEAKKLAQTIECQKEQLLENAKFAAIGEMANGIAHQINNPLLIITGKIAALQKKLTSKKVDLEQITDELDKISKSANRIAGIVTSLKEFSKEPSLENYQTHNLNSIIKCALNLCSEKFILNEIELRLDVDANISLFCQKSQMIKVIISLLMNSLHAIEKLNKKWIQIETRKTAHTFEIMITDSGSGIPSDIQENIMHPFFTTKENRACAGLGLSTSKGIIESQNGKFYLDKDHLNTRFVISFPNKINELQKAA